MNLRDRSFSASSIAKEAMTETESTYEDRLQDYRNRNYTYIPLPEDGQYYNVKEGWLRPLDEEQWITPETHLLDVMGLLQQQPFLLYEGSDSEYWIINLADLDKRGIREMLYPPIAELESLIASRLQDHHPESEQMIDDLSDSAINARTIGGWYRDRKSDVELHIAEYINLTEMKQVLSEGRPALFRSCGFEEEDEISDLLDIRDLRNKVMHVNRSLVRSRRDIQDILDVIERTQERITKATGGD
jgi:hypothetical protein